MIDILRQQYFLFFFRSENSGCHKKGYGCLMVENFPSLHFIIPSKEQQQSLAVSIRHAENLITNKDKDVEQTVRRKVPVELTRLKQR